MSAVADPMSPSSSLSLSPTRSRRLSSRRGSVSAADPWGTHSDINLNPFRTTSSRLTIVRVPPQNEEEPQRRHMRHGSNASIGSNSSSKADGPRMSFAFSSFSPPSPGGMGPGTGRPASPNTSPRMRAQSPTLMRRYSGTASKLSPDQLVEVARQSCNPRPSVAPQSNGGSPVRTTAVSAPALFTPLPDSIFLPFINRPAEVSSLVSTPPTAKLFALLAQTFPAEARMPLGTESTEALLARDPRQWTYAELEYWLKNVDRDVADDALWVCRARACILAKSELIWERIKGAFGVPPELDIDEEELPSVLEPPLETPVETAVITDKGETEASSYPLVFESPSPLPPAENPSPHPDELSIEPVIASHSQPPSTFSLDQSSHELSEVREEDENEEASSDDANTNADAKKDEPEVHGLRIVTSPMSPGGPGRSYTMSPGGSPSPLPLGSPPVSARALDEHDAPYDATRERGPGHPLFPSSFAHLSFAPTLRANNRAARAQSMWAPPPPKFSSPHAIRTGINRPTSIGVGGGTSGNPRFLRPEWAQAYDPARHEFAVASSAGSVSGRE
ncbi:hypothetical protein AcV5_009427 [Taiwanofungus camphoratus]|nr:hypothetical protein AcV5_009427 [Antrodia cinnamomea]